jgi:hypothetical protein
MSVVKNPQLERLRMSNPTPKYYATVGELRCEDDIPRV